MLLAKIRVQNVQPIFEHLSMNIYNSFGHLKLLLSHVQSQYSRPNSI